MEVRGGTRNLPGTRLNAVVAYLFKVVDRVSSAKHMLRGHFLSVLVSHLRLVFREVSVSQRIRYAFHQECFMSIVRP